MGFLEIGKRRKRGRNKKREDGGGEREGHVTKLTVTSFCQCTCVVRTQCKLFAIASQGFIQEFFHGEVDLLFRGSGGMLPRTFKIDCSEICHQSTRSNVEMGVFFRSPLSYHMNTLMLPTQLCETQPLTFIDLLHGHTHWIRTKITQLWEHRSEKQ